MLETQFGKLPNIQRTDSNLNIAFSVGAVLVFGLLSTVAVCIQVAPTACEAFWLIRDEKVSAAKLGTRSFNFAP